MAKKKSSTRRTRKTTGDGPGQQAIPHPRDIKACLDKVIVGQDRVKKILAVAVTNHYARLHGPMLATADPNLADVMIEKSSLLLIGPTGSGKTYLAKTLADLLSVPFAIGDATSLTEAGYFGQDSESLVFNLLDAADGNVQLAQQGVVYLDEIDKVRRMGDDGSTTRDVGGEGVQQALLKILEGSLVHAPEGGRRFYTEAIDSTNILFICGGAFVGLEDIVARRLSDNGHVDLASRGDLLTHVLPHDLIEFGLIPELVGRLPVVATLHQLGQHDLEQILVAPKNALLEQYRKICLLRGFDVTFTNAAVSAIAAIALKLGTGARGLRSVVEQVMNDVMFNAEAGYRYHIDEDVVAGRKAPRAVKL